MKRPEEATHRAIASALALCLPKPWLYWHTPNGGGRSKAEGGILKALGTKPGIPDLFVAGEGRVVALEVKAAKGRLSPAQKDTIGALAEAGIPTVIVHSLPEAIDALKALGVPLKGRAL
jgi:hypothetical protein